MVEDITKLFENKCALHQIVYYFKEQEGYKVFTAFSSAKQNGLNTE